MDRNQSRINGVINRLIRKIDKHHNIEQSEKALAISFLEKLRKSESLRKHLGFPSEFSEDPELMETFVFSGSGVMDKPDDCFLFWWKINSKLNDGRTT